MFDSQAITQMQVSPHIEGFAIEWTLGIKIRDLFHTLIAGVVRTAGESHPIV
jgi:hypothetical protein